jgi:inner membrane protein
MLLFGHIGFTLAGFLLLNSPLRKNRFITQPETLEQSENVPKIPALKGLSARLWALITRTKSLDMRFVIAGSLLPDIIDKPIGHYFFYETFGNGYLWGHTLLFLIFLTLAGYLTNVIVKRNYILLLAFGCFIHLILDFMILNPRVFLWPLLGLTFEKGTSRPFGEWLLGLVTQVVDKPWIAIPEVTGAIITIWFIWLLWRQKKLRSFIVKGQI